MEEDAYFSKLHEAFLKLYGCEAYHVETVLVVERLKSDHIWEVNVEVFDLSGHPEAARAYAFAYDHETESEVIVVLELPPVICPRTALRAALLELRTHAVA
jgi:hypothetical protein